MLGLLAWSALLRMLGFACLLGFAEMAKLRLEAELEKLRSAAKWAQLLLQRGSSNLFDGTISSIRRAHVSIRRPDAPMRSGLPPHPLSLPRPLGEVSRKFLDLGLDLGLD